MVIAIIAQIFFDSFGQQLHRHAEFPLRGNSARFQASLSFSLRSRSHARSALKRSLQLLAFAGQEIAQGQEMRVFERIGPSFS
jgi:hypothetical protein